MKYKFNTVLKREYKSRERIWVDVETVTQEEINNFFNSEVFISFISKYGEEKSKINKHLTYNDIKRLFESEKEGKINSLAYRQLKKSFKELIS